MEFEYAAATDQGKRRLNQDSMLCMQAKTPRGNVFLAVVCDGMGGLSKGELASADLVRSMERWFSGELPKIIAEGFYEDRLFSGWRTIVSKANEKLIVYGKRHGIELGTTLSGLLLFEDRFYIIHVGDTRIYEITGDRITCLTKDHTLAMREVERGELKPEDMEKDKRRSILTQCIGAVGDCKPDLFSGDVQDGAVFVLCSDGFRHLLSAEEIRERMRPEKQVSKDAMSQNLHELIQENLLRGERDNISVIAIKNKKV